MKLEKRKSLNPMSNVKIAIAVLVSISVVSTAYFLMKSGFFDQQIFFTTNDQAHMRTRSRSLDEILDEINLLQLHEADVISEKEFSKSSIPNVSATFQLPETPGKEFRKNSIPDVSATFQLPQTPPQAPVVTSLDCFDEDRCVVINHIAYGRSGNRLKQLQRVERLLGKCSGAAVSPVEVTDAVVRFLPMQIFGKASCRPDWERLEVMEHVMGRLHSKCQRFNFTWREKYPGIRCRAAASSQRAFRRVHLHDRCFAMGSFCKKAI